MLYRNQELYTLDRDESSLSYLGELPGTGVRRTHQKNQGNHLESEEERGASKQGVTAHKIAKW